MRPQYQAVPVPLILSAYLSMRLWTQEAVVHLPLAQISPASPRYLCLL